jgi:hypothetical protein
MKALACLGVLLWGNAAASAQDAALPSRAVKVQRSSPIAIPEQFSPPQEASASSPDAAAATPPVPPPPSACQQRLATLAAFKPLPVLFGPGECGAADVVLLQSVIVPDQGQVVLSLPATLRCPIAEQVALWVRQDVAPVANKLGSSLRGVDTDDSYECRGRNRVRAAKMSEHGRANALDVRGFRLASGRVIELTDLNVDKDLRDGLRASACARFSTVLGPGSDGNHEEHIHLDLAERRGGYKMCEWDVRVPLAHVDKGEEKADAGQSEDPVPLPRPRPLAKASDETPSPSRRTLWRVR